MRKWRTFKRPPAKTKGLIVIETDDGYQTDFDLWYPFFRKMSKEYSEFAPYNLIPFCPAVNTGYIGTESYLSLDQLKIISEWTEIMNHGGYHAGLGLYPLSSPAAAGQNRINLSKANEVQIPSGYEYIISEGGLSERIKPISSDNMDMPISTRTGTYLILENNLINSYTTAARIQVSQEALNSELQGALQTLSGWGIQAENHVFPYHSGSQYFVNPTANTAVKNAHASSRGSISSVYTINQKGTNLNNLTAMGNTLTQAQINALIVDLKATDGVFIWFFHGSNTARPFLEMLIRSAMAAGVRIVTRKEAVKHLNS